MNDIAHYIKWRGDLTFDVAPLNEVDALILSTMAYFPFDLIVRKTFSAAPVMISKALTKFKLEKENQMVKELAELVSSSKRFNSIYAAAFVNEVDESLNTQFSAVTFILEDEKPFVAFRGTDNSLAGWKENMDLAYEDQVPAQHKAVKYLRRVAKRFKGDLLVGGHSKGGNLSVYSAAFSGNEIQKRIDKIYNFDGPGFNPEVIDNNKFKNITPKIHTYVPQDSIVGILLEHTEDYVVIRSLERGGANQHNPLTWEAEPDKFVYMDSLSRLGRFGQENLCDWINGLSYDERREFVNVLYGLIKKENLQTVDEIFETKNIISMLNSYAKLGKEEKLAVKDTLSELGSTIMDKLIIKRLPNIIRKGSERDDINEQENV